MMVRGARVELKYGQVVSYPRCLIWPGMDICWLCNVNVARNGQPGELSIPCFDT